MPFDRDKFRDEYPWQSRWFDRQGLAMHYVDEGEGEPVVLVHGNPTWSFYFRKLIADLSGSFRTVAPDHMGMGLSDKPGDDQYDYCLASRVDDLEALLDHLGVNQDITLVLHDWGGMVGLAYAERHPDRVRRVVLLNTAGFLLPEGRSLPWQLKLIKGFPMAFAVRGLNAFSRGAVWTCSTRKGRMNARLKEAYLSPYDSWGHRIAVHRFVQDIPLGPDDPSYAQVRAVEDSLVRLRDLPVQIFWGERDFVFDMHFLAEWRKRLPDADYHTFSDCGHYVLEDAHEEIVPLLRGFLEQNPLSGAASAPVDTGQGLSQGTPQ